VRSATVAAQDFPDADIRVIDTRVIGSPLCTMVQQAALWAEAGVDADSIVQRLQSMTDRARLYFLVPSLEFLQRGGRIGGAQALLGSVLQIKPILCLQDGRVDRYESERTYKRALARLKELVVEQFPHAGAGFLTIMHAGVPDEGNALAADLSKRVNQEDVPVYNVPPAIVTHGGPGLLAASFFTD
jgi:DegV family protein with EDD domain